MIVFVVFVQLILAPGPFLALLDPFLSLSGEFYWKIKISALAGPEPIQRRLCHLASNMTKRGMHNAVQARWPYVNFARFPHFNYNVKPKLAGRLLFIGLWIWNFLWCESTLNILLFCSHCIYNSTWPAPFSGRFTSNPSSLLKKPFGTWTWRLVIWILKKRFRSVS